MREISHVTIFQMLSKKELKRLIDQVHKWNIHLESQCEIQLVAESTILANSIFLLFYYYFFLGILLEPNIYLVAL